MIKKKVCKKTITKKKTGKWAVRKYKTSRIYDNGGKTIDRYTVITSKNRVFGFDEDPYRPQGFGQFSHDWKGGSTKHLGKKITTRSLPVKARKYVKQVSKY
jgi:hypothetical protein